MPSVIIVAERDTGRAGALSDDRRTFQLEERPTSSDVSAQLIERIGWALADAERAEQTAGAGSA